PSGGVYSPNTGDVADDCPGFTTGSSSWTCSTATCFAPCTPSATASCNMIGVTATDTQPYTFGRVFGLPVGVSGVNSGTVNGGGAAGGNPVVYAANSPQASAPVDVVLVVDRTSSMSGYDTDNARTAASSVVTLYTPSTEYMAFGMLGPSKNSGGCTTTPDSPIGTAGSADLHRWIPVGLSGAGVSQSSTSAAPGQVVASDYSLITAANNCYTNSSTGTDLADPLYMAQYELDMYGNPAHSWGIILETDGQPNASTAPTNATDPGNYCEQANTAATSAKNDTHNAALGAVTNAQPHAGGITIFTIGFGLDGSNNVQCPDSSGTFKGRTARDLLVSAASSYAADNACTTNPYNTPAPAGQVEHFYCVPKQQNVNPNLSAVFQAVASSLASGAHLVQLPVPPPIVSSVSPATGSLSHSTTVTLTGQYFSTVFAVTGASSYTVLSDTQMTAVMPSVGSAGPVSITVTNPGGTSNAATFTYTSP
ncbi:MAG: IPT/TIG domain-containing protein, partial [Mycobacterium sp.]|nr:IPT/TIG domain-containing protein [Mycobacterium sp.]